MLKLCKCGCGQVVKSQEFVYGHKLIWKQNWKAVCKCGCSQVTTPGCDYIAGHSTRLITKEEYKIRGKKISQTMQANPLTEEQRKHLSERNKGEKNPAYGKPISDELRKKRGESIKKRWDDPVHHEKQAAAIRAVTSTPEFQDNIKRRKGVDHPGWKGGISKLSRGPGWSNGIKKRVKERDNYRCIACNTEESVLKFPLNIHHVDYNRRNHKFINLVSLCRSCHGRVNKNKDQYKELFIQYLNAIYSDPDILANYTDYDPVQVRLEAIRTRMSDDEFQAKIKRRKGKDHPHYNNGSSGTHLGISYNRKLKWREQIFDRDNRTCQICSKTKEDNIVLCMHHINYIRTDFRDDNLITLCFTCNNKTSWNRKYYEDLLYQKAITNITNYNGV